MVRAYYYNDTPEDQRYPHEYDPSRPVSLETLERIGVKYRAIPVEGHEQAIDDVAKELDYKNRDDINVTKEGLGDLYESKIKGFFEEHLHEDEEIRYIAGGSGFFDVRESPSDQWIRIAVEAGDLLVLPAGIYHRFTLDTNDKLSAKRLFKDEPKWTPINRSQKTDENPYRVEYREYTE